MILKTALFCIIIIKILFMGLIDLKAYAFYDTEERTRMLPFYVHTFCDDYPQEDQYYDCFDINQLNLVVSGSGGVDCEGVHYDLKPGDLFLFSVRSQIHYYPGENGLHLRFITFSGFACEPLFAYFDIKKCHCFRHNATETALNDLLASILRNADVETVSSMLYAMLVGIGRFLQQPSPSDGLQKALRYLESNYQFDLPMNAIAQAGNLSESVFYKCFRKKMGMTPSAYRNNIRIEWAKHLLISHPRMSIHTVGERVGFHSTSYFVACFRKIVGVTPTAFRRQASSPLKSS